MGDSMTHVFKCKMCGGVLEVKPGDTVCECEYCGAVQTLPRLDSDKKANLYDRASYLRRSNDFDRAMGVYEQILSEDKTDAEAYWSLVLCRYGIEYVEDPATHKRIPTVNRAQFTSVFSDEDYQSAIRYADEEQRKVYEAEAKAIDDIQKGILEISMKEDPFDIFICYKETDDNGRRTIDSVLAYDLYQKLTEEGYKVFFSRVTLEDKVGIAYEPYIFAALNSAKIMLAVGTRPEYFNAVWVKNEWSRYLALIRKGAKKTLIPLYKDMNPYDLPEEFSHLQAQDMGRLGYQQDLIRGIHKILDDKKPKATVKETVVVSSAQGVALDTLLKRGYLALEDGNWEKAEDFSEQVLNHDPENADAYVIQLLKDLKVRRSGDLSKLDEPFDTNSNYQKAVRYGDEKLKASLTNAMEQTRANKEAKRLRGLYDTAVDLMNSAATEAAYKNAAEAFRVIPEYEDSDALAEKCLGLAEDSRKDAIYTAAKALMKGNDISKYEQAIKQFESILDWMDSDTLLADCKNEILRIQTKKKARKKKGIISLTVLVCLIISVCLGLYVNNHYLIPDRAYQEATQLEENGMYLEAYDAFSALGDYKDSAERRDMIYQSHQIVRFSSAKPGDVVRFGHYEQDGIAETTNEQIEWYVLKNEDGRLLLISKYVLDCKPYNESFVDTTWSTSPLRDWLNNEFITIAFDENELSCMERRSTGDGQGYNTTDIASLLNKNEAKKYRELISGAKSTKYAQSHGAHVVGVWWLLSRGGSNTAATAVESNGSVREVGYSVTKSDCGVRPVIQIIISKCE